MWLLVIDGLNGLVDVGECFCCFELAFQDIFPAFFPSFEVFDKLCRISILLEKVWRGSELTLSIMSSAALKSANTAPTSA